jgi:hypothetical protein
MRMNNRGRYEKNHVNAAIDVNPKNSAGIASAAVMGLSPTGKGPRAPTVVCGTRFVHVDREILPILDQRPSPERDEQQTGGAVFAPTVSRLFFDSPTVRKRATVVDPKATQVARPKYETVHCLVPGCEILVPATMV